MKRKKGRRAPLKTDARLLEKLPQFGPATGLDIRYADINPRRRQKIRKLLTGCIEPYVRTDEPNALGRFLRETEHNIAIYIDQRNMRQPAFDREKAKKYVHKAANTVRAAKKDLQAIAGWPELSSFLERLSVQVGKRSEGGPSNSALHVIKRIEKAKRNAIFSRPFSRSIWLARFLSSNHCSTSQSNDLHFNPARTVRRVTSQMQWLRLGLMPRDASPHPRRNPFVLVDRPPL